MTLNFCEICDAIKDLHKAKEASYAGSNVIDDLPEELWRAQVAIKGMRLYRAASVQKQVDEALDAATYAILWLEKMSKQGVDITPILGIGVEPHTTQKTLAQLLRDDYIETQIEGM